MQKRSSQGFAGKVAQRAKAAKKAWAQEQNRYYTKMGLEDGVTMVKREGKWVAKHEVSRVASAAVGLRSVRSVRSVR